MPNFNSTKAAAQGATPPTAAVRSGIGAEVLLDSIVMGTTHAANDTITMLKIPKGFTVSRIDYSISAKPAATSGTYQFGDGTTAARFGTTAAVTAAVTGSFVPVDQTAMAVDTNLVLTISALVGGTPATHTILVSVYGTFNP